MGRCSSGRDADGRSILIIGVNYRPETTGIAPYTAGMAEHLVEAGARVTVFTGMPSYPQWRIFDGYRDRWRTRERINGVMVHRARHYVPVRQTALHRGLYEGTFLLQGLRTLALPRPDAVIGVVPALGGGIAARLAGQRFNVPYGLIFQDLMGPGAAQSGVKGGQRVSRATRAAEAWAVRRAAAVAAITSGFFPYLESIGVVRGRLAELPNWVHVQPPASDRRAVRRRLGWKEGVHVVLHAGNMGAKQALEQVVDAARLARYSDLSVQFVLMGDGSQRRALERRAAGLENVAFLAPVDRATFPDVLAAADALLLTERASLAGMCLPSKLTSYFAAGRPVIAATPAGGATARELERAGAALVVAAERPTLLLGAIARLAGDRALQERLAASGKRYAAEHLSPERAFERLDTFLDAVLNPRRC